MPANVRNFWIELDVDGMRTAIATGPRNKEGGFSMIIRQRDKGSIITAMRISGRAGDDGRLVLEAEAVGHDAAIKVQTTRV